MTRSLLIISGSSRGIGKAVAELFTENGWSIWGIARSDAGCAYERHFTFDLGCPDIGELVAELKQALEGQQWSRIALVHNAFSYYKDSIDAPDLAAFNVAANVALKSPMAINAAVKPYMNSGSSIIYIGSTLAHKAVAGCAGYVTLKHAVAGLAKATCQDLAKSGIHSCCVHPGFTRTEMLSSHISDEQAITDNLCIERLLAPSEVAEMVWFCQQHPMVNGAGIDVNLGQIEK